MDRVPDLASSALYFFQVIIGGGSAFLGTPPFICEVGFFQVMFFIFFLLFLGPRTSEIVYDLKARISDAFDFCMA